MKPVNCDSLRPLLFAFVDGDLEPADKTRVEEHVHSCRDCGTELSRVELETLRLREALVPMEPSTDFTQSVMDQVRKIAASADSGEPPRDFTENVMSRVRREAGVPEPERRGWVLAVLTAAALLLLLPVLQLLRDPGQQRSDPNEGFVVQTSSSAGYGVGQSLQWPSEIELANETLVFGDGPRRVEILGPARVDLLGADRLRVLAGRLRIESEAGDDREVTTPLRIDLPDGRHVALTAGSFALDVDEVDLASANLLPEGVKRVALRVLRGNASLQEEGREAMRIGPASLAVLEPLRPLVVHSLPTPDFEPGRRVRSAPLVVVGRVTDVEHDAVKGSRVELLAEGRRWVTTSQSDGRYEFEIAAEDWKAASAAWLRATPPTGRDDLAEIAFEPLRRGLDAGDTVFTDLPLPARRRVEGRVLAATGSPIANARVRALRVDAFFKNARLLDAGQTDGGGEFRFAGFAPANDGEQLVLLIEPKEPGAPPIAAYDSRDRRGRNWLVRAPAVREVDLPIQSNATRRVWIEKRPQGLAGRFFRRFERKEVFAGTRSVRVRVAAGQKLRWWEDAGLGRPSQGFAAKLDAPAAASQWLVSGTKPIAADELPVDAPSQLMLASSDRNAARSAERRGTASLGLRFVDALSGTAMSNARVWLGAPGTAPWFAGLSDVDGRLAVTGLAMRTELDAFAIADGKLVATRLVLATADEQRTLEMSEPRRLSGQLPIANGPRIVDVHVYDGKHECYATSVELGEDGRLELGELPSGRVRIRADGRSCEVDNRKKSSLPPFGEWGQD